MDRLPLFAAHLFTLASSNGAAPEWIQLTPSTTEFGTRDGRGPFKIVSASALIAASLANGPIGVDYNHATDVVMESKSGAPTPAAGWIEELLAHGPNNEPGIWGRVKWTPKGALAVAEGEYRYISPVLLSNKQNELVAIGRAALTNDPALVMKGLFSIQELAQPMNREQLCDMLGVPHNSSDQDIHQAAIKKTGGDRKKLFSALGLPETATDDDVMSAVRKTGVQASTMANIQRVLEAAGLKGKTLDDTTTTALCAKLQTTTAPAGAGDLEKTVDDLQKQLASLHAKLAGRDAETEVAAAIAAGKITPGQKDWAVSYCTRDPEGFKAFVGAAPRIVPAGSNTGHLGVPEDGLTEQEKQICALMGVKEEDFKKTRAALKTEKA